MQINPYRIISNYTRVSWPY